MPDASTSAQPQKPLWGGGLPASGTGATGAVGDGGVEGAAGVAFCSGKASTYPGQGGVDRYNCGITWIS